MADDVNVELTQSSNDDVSYIERLRKTVETSIKDWKSVNKSVKDVIERYVRVAKSSTSSVPVVVKYVQAKAIGHTHLGPQAVWFGQDYAKVIIGYDDTVSNQDLIVLPLVFKPGLVPDYDVNDSFAVTSSPFASPINTYSFSVRGKWVFYVTSPVLFSDYGVIRWSDVVIKDDLPSFGDDDEGLDIFPSGDDIMDVDEGQVPPGAITAVGLARLIEDGAGLWLGPQELVTIANLYELKKTLETASMFPEMYRFNFAEKPGDVA